MSRPKVPLFIALCAWLAASPLIVGVYAHASWLGAIDRPVVAFITAAHNPWLNQVMLMVTSIGNPNTITLLTLLIMLGLAWHHAYWPAIFIGTSVGGLSLTNHLLKMWLQRPRPFIADPTIHPLTTAAGYSFPSGHATAAMALGGALIFLARKLRRNYVRWLGRLLLALTILAIGLSRIYVQVHYPTDVLAGYLIALGGLQLLWWFMTPKLTVPQ